MAYQHSVPEAADEAGRVVRHHPVARVRIPPARGDLEMRIRRVWIGRQDGEIREVLVRADAALPRKNGGHRVRCVCCFCGHGFRCLPGPGSTYCEWPPATRSLVPCSHLTGSSSCRLSSCLISGTLVYGLPVTLE